MPFGGVKASGNGWREPGTEALDVYSDWKNIYVNYDPRAAARCPLPPRPPSPSFPPGPGSKRVPGQERPPARRPSAARLHHRRARARAACSPPWSSRPTASSYADDRPALRRRGAVPAPGGDGRRPVARHRMGRAHARRARRRRAARFDCFSILRPTSPFRSAGDDPRAWAAFRADAGRRLAARGREVPAASRARCGCVEGDRLLPLLPLTARRSALAQHASTRRCPRSTSRTRAWRSPGRRAVAETGTIAGTRDRAVLHRRATRDST